MANTKIQNVDYEGIPSKATNIRNNGQSLNSELTKAYNFVKSMHNHWYGKRYNELVKAFNKIIPSLNDMSKLVVVEIPSTLEQIANNYSLADTGKKVTTVNNQQPHKISDIPLGTETGMKFLLDLVKTDKESVSKSFKKAKSYMEKIDSDYRAIKWSSEAADAFRNKFNSLKKKINDSFDNIESQFAKLMQQTMDDISKAEQANTVK